VNSRFSLGIVLVLSLASCGGDGYGGGTVGDKGFVSDFVVYNSSNYVVEVAYGFSPASGRASDSDSFLIQPGGNELFYSDVNLASSIQGAPSPQSTFDSIDIHTEINQTQVFTADKLDNSVWDKTVQNQKTTYALSIIDADFVP